MYVVGQLKTEKRIQRNLAPNNARTTTSIKKKLARRGMSAPEFTDAEG